MLKGLIRAKVWIVILMVGIASIAFGVRGIMENNREPIDISECNWAELKVGDHIQGNIDVLFPAYAQTVNKASVTGEYYALPHVVNDGQMFTIDDFIGIYVRCDSAPAEPYNGLAEASVTWWTTDAQEIGHDSIYIDGIIKEMPKEFPDYFSDYLADMGYDSGYIGNTHYKLAIYPAEKNTTLLIAIGAAATLAGLGGIIFNIRKR